MIMVQRLIRVRYQLPVADAIVLVLFVVVYQFGNFITAFRKRMAWRWLSLTITKIIRLISILWNKKLQENVKTNTHRDKPAYNIDPRILLSFRFTLSTSLQNQSKLVTLDYISSLLLTYIIMFFSGIGPDTF